jgi:hypothetical protein
LACGLAVEHERGMDNPLVGSGRGDISRRERLAGRGGSGDGHHRRARVPASGGAYDLRHLAHRDQGGAWCSPRGCEGRSCGGRRRTTMTGGGRARLSRRKVMPGCPRRLDPTVGLGVDL